MKVQGFKLKENGLGGIVMTITDPALKGGITVMDEKQITRPLAIPQHLKESVQRLKYFYLILTGHFIPEYAEFMDGYNVIKKSNNPLYDRIVSLFENTKIQAVSTKGKDQFVITGFIKTLAGRGCCINTPLVTDADENHFEALDDCFALIREIFEDVKKFVLSEAKEMAQPKQFLLDFSETLKGDKQDELVEWINNCEEPELEQRMIQILEKKGCIVITNNDTVEEEKEVEVVVTEVKKEKKEKTKGKVIQMEAIPAVEGSRRQATGTHGKVAEDEAEF